jgi:hypothetical protein
MALSQDRAVREMPRGKHALEPHLYEQETPGVRSAAQFENIGSMKYYKMRRNRDGWPGCGTGGALMQRCRRHRCA